MSFSLILQEMMATINRLEKEKAKLVQANRINGFDSKVKRLNEKVKIIPVGSLYICRILN